MVQGGAWSEGVLPGFLRALEAAVRWVCSLYLGTRNEDRARTDQWERT